MSALEFSSQDNEPFLRLPPPLDNFILTPPRSSDGESHVAALNDPRVYNFLIGPPYPYRQADWDQWYPTIAKGCQRSLELYCPKAPLYEPEVKHPSGESGDGSQAPVRTIREIDPATGRQTYAGDIQLKKCSFVDVVDENERQRLKNENDSWPTADKEIIYEVGYLVVPSYHGRGIMTSALRTLLQKFAIPDLNVHKMRVTYFGHNIASRRVFEKNGFIYRDTVPNAVTLSESKGGGKMDLGVLTWTREDV